MSGKRSWYTIKAAGTSPAVIYLYGIIGQDWWGDGNSALDFCRELDALAPRDIELHVNSAGGDVFEGMAIYNALLRYQGNVTAYVDGLAASAASFLIMAANERVMGEGAFLMIHNSWTCCCGDALDLRDVATRLEAVDDQQVGIYAHHSTRAADEIREAMAATTWLPAEEAVEWGLADRIEEGLKAVACVTKAVAHLLLKDQVPEGVEVVDETPEPAIEEPGDTTPIIETATDDDPESAGQEPDAEDQPQEQPVCRTVAMASGIYRFPVKEESAP